MEKEFELKVVWVTFLGDRNFWYNDWGDDYVAVQICKTTSNYKIKIGQLYFVETMPQ